MNTMADKSNNRISELLIKGNTMGIVQGREILNQNPSLDKNTKSIINEFIQLQENNIEKLKTYL